MGRRPSSYTEAVGHAILEGITGGLAWTTACGRAGITRDTGERWLRRVPVFRAAVEQARYAAKARNELKIQMGRAQWQSAAWWLERRYPDEYGRRLPLLGDGTGAAGSPEELMVVGFLAKRDQRKHDRKAP
jgi:hypothetical protein